LDKATALAQRLSKVEHGAFVLCQVERASRWGPSAGAGFKKNQVGAARKKLERNACSTLLIIDAQSVKNTDTAIHKGYDASKKVSSIKRHIAVDTLGLPHTMAVTTADVTDRKGGQWLHGPAFYTGCVPDSGRT